MEDVLDNQMKSQELQITNSMRESLRTQAYWARLLGIVGMVMYSLLCLAFLFGGSFIMSALSASTAMPGFGMGIMIVYAIFFGVGIFFSYLLFTFGKKTLLALNNNDQNSLEFGASKLALVFKILGILTAIILCLYAFMLISALAMFGFASMGH